MFKCISQLPTAGPKYYYYGGPVINRFFLKVFCSVEFGSRMVVSTWLYY
jgi:hypothetical protein